MSAPTSTAEISSFIQHRVLPVTAHFEEEELYTYITLYKAVKKIFQFTDVRFRDDVVKGFLQILDIFFNFVSPPSKEPFSIWVCFS